MALKMLPEYAWRHIREYGSLWLAEMIYCLIYVLYPDDYGC